MFLQCCYSVVTVLLQCCYSVVTVLLQCCAMVSLMDLGTNHCSIYNTGSHHGNVCKTRACVEAAAKFLIYPVSVDVSGCIVFVSCCVVLRYAVSVCANANKSHGESSVRKRAE
jgi:hypothetical protein